MPKHLEITIDGVTRNLVQWSERFGVLYKTVHSRIQNGWPIEKALRTKVSSTGRGVEREDNDFYATPDWMVTAGLDAIDTIRNYNGPWVLPPKAGHVIRMLEPACGDGAITAPMFERYPNAHIDYFDIAPQDSYPCVATDFLLQTPPTEGYDLVITNPPYLLAREFVDQGLRFLTFGGALVLLFRINFFGGQRRATWMRSQMPEWCFVTPRRPSFRGKGTDSTEYAWFVWSRGSNPKYTKTILMETEKDKYK